MKHKTWFRLVIKAIGVLLIGFALNHVVQFVIQLTYVYLYDPFGSSGIFPLQGVWWTMQYLPPALGALAQLIVGLYLFFGGGWIVNKVVPSNPRYCPECGYDLSKSTAPNCPECGTEVTKIETGGVGRSGPSSLRSSGPA